MPRESRRAAGLLGLALITLFLQISVAAGAQGAPMRASGRRPVEEVLRRAPVRGMVPGVDIAWSLASASSHPPVEFAETTLAPAIPQPSLDLALLLGASTTPVADTSAQRPAASDAWKQNVDPGGGHLADLVGALAIGSLFSLPALLDNGAEISGYQHATLTWWSTPGALSESGAADALRPMDRLLMFGLPIGLAVWDFRAAGRDPGRGTVFGVNAATMSVLGYDYLRVCRRARSKK
jgi:hypothetical protein